MSAMEAAARVRRIEATRRVMAAATAIAADERTNVSAATSSSYGGTTSTLSFDILAGLSHILLVTLVGLLGNDASRRARARAYERRAQAAGAARFARIAVQRASFSLCFWRDKRTRSIRIERLGCAPCRLCVDALRSQPCRRSRRR